MSNILLHNILTMLETKSVDAQKIICKNINYEQRNHMIIYDKIRN